MTFSPKMMTLVPSPPSGGNETQHMHIPPSYSWLRDSRLAHPISSVSSWVFPIVCIKNNSDVHPGNAGTLEEIFSDYVLTHLDGHV